MTYKIARYVFSKHYSVAGLFYKWIFEFLEAVHPDTKYDFGVRVVDKWIKNDREFVAYEGVCKDEPGNVVFTTRRAHVLDFIKRTAPKVGEGGLDSSDGRAPDSPRSLALDAMATAAASARRDAQAKRSDVADSAILVKALASGNTELGSPLPSIADFYSQARFDRDAGTGEGGGGKGTRSRHYDIAAARQEGLPATFTGGPAVMTLIHNSALQFFGEGWVKGGRADLTMARPVFAGDFLVAKGFVKGKELLADGSVRLTCETWVENQSGQKKTVGTVSGIVR